MFRCPILFLGYIKALVAYKNIKMVSDNYKLKKYWAKLIQFSRGARRTFYFWPYITVELYNLFTKMLRKYQGL